MQIQILTIINANEELIFKNRLGVYSFLTNKCPSYFTKTVPGSWTLF